MRQIVALALLATAAGCTSASGEPGFSGRTCDAGPAQSLVGQPASSEIAATAQKLTGAGAVRWLQPGEIITMEYRSDRLNLVLDGQNRIEAIRCG